MERDAIVIYAENDPMPGVAHPGPHQTYRHPRVEVEMRTLGALPADAIRVEMLYAGVCGTDLHLVQKDPRTGYIRNSSPVLIPDGGRVIGHEGLGRIVGVGSSVQHLRTGAVVAFNSILVCHDCERCRQGLFNQCRNSRLLGMEQDGVFATMVDVPASLAQDVTELIRDERDAMALACLEPAGVAFVACENGRVGPGEEVVIFGAGPIGVYAAMLARVAFGAGVIHVVEPSPFRREFAARWADHVHAPADFFAHPPDLIDVAIEASADMSNVDRVLRQMNANGRIVLLGRSGERLTLDAADHLITNAVSITGSRGHLGGAFHSLLALYRQGRFSPGEIVTRVLGGLGELADLLRSSDQVALQDCKILVKLQHEQSR